MKFDQLFARRDSLPNRRSRDEPRFAAKERRLLPPMADQDESDLPFSTPLAGGRTHGRFDPRRMSPRQMADWAHEMYLCRMLNWDEYCMAGFPAELHPHYNRTVGALTGNVAQPDAPRNMVRVWEERLSFALRYFAEGEPEVARSEKILQLLKSQIPPRAV